MRTRRRRGRWVDYLGMPRAFRVPIEKAVASRAVSADDDADEV